MPRSQAEGVEQRKLAAWLDLRFNGYWWHTPNGGRREAISGAMLQREGVKKGIADIMIDAPFVYDRAYTGVAIELKRPESEDGKKRSYASRNQKAWLLAHKWSGRYTAVCWGADEAIDLITKLYGDQPLPHVKGRTLRVCWTCLREMHPRVNRDKRRHKCMREGHDTCQGTIREFSTMAEVHDATVKSPGEIRQLERIREKRREAREARKTGDVTERMEISEVLAFLSK